MERLEHYKFLVKLRNSGATNMFGASPYLQDTFDLDGQEAKTILSDWMRSFNLPEEQQPKDGR